MAIEMVDSEQEQNITSVEDGKTWVDTPTMLEIMGVSKSTLYKRIDKGEVESEKLGATRLFKVDRELVNGHQTYDFPHLENRSNGVGKHSEKSYSEKYVQRLEDEITYLKERIEKQDRELSEQKQELSEQKKRSDTIVLRYTEIFDQRLLGNNKPFWKFW